jgi:AraC-like DNA-binding protein
MRNDVLPQLVLGRHSAALRGTLPPGEQRVGPLAELPGLLHELGARPATILRRVGLSPTALADRDGRIAFASIGRLLDACVLETGCPHLGLLLGGRWRLEHVGLAGELAGSCTTVGRALDVFTSNQWMNSSGGVVFLGRHAKVTTLGYAIVEPGMVEGVDQIQDCVVAIGARMVRELSRLDDWAPTEVTLSRKRPVDIGPYRKLFRAPVRFDAETTALYFPTAFEATRVPGGDDVRRRVLEGKLAQVGREELLPKLHRMIRVAMVFGLTLGDDIAAAMGLTRRTFNRRIAQTGTTFHEALETVRSEVARQLLLDTELAVGEVALALGYGETSAFIRAFRRWTGKTPAAWRQGVGAAANATLGPGP